MKNKYGMRKDDNFFKFEIILTNDEALKIAEPI
jgi:hypothetical protein